MSVVLPRWRRPGCTLGAPVSRLRRVQTPYGEGGALPAVLLVILVGVTLSALLVPILLGQFHTTRRADARSQALAAAQTGLQVALGRLRAARTSGSAAANGDLSLLPCATAQQPLAGKADTAGRGRYSVRIYYVSAEPRLIDENYLLNPSAAPQPRHLGCTPPSAPAFAVLFSTGSVNAGSAVGTVSRQVRGTYTFVTSIPRFDGGQFHTQVGGYCLDAGSGDPPIGSSVTLQICAPGVARQRLTYDANLTIGIADSRTAALPLGKCLEQTGSSITVQECGRPDKPAQQWGIGLNNWMRGTTDGRTFNDFCLDGTFGDTVGSVVTTGAFGYSCLAFLPDATVGAGRAGAAAPSWSAVAGQRQLANLEQYSRCIDIDGYNIDNPNLTVYPCKQAADPAELDWNQRFTMPESAGGAPAVGTISTVVSDKPKVTTPQYVGERVCLRSPLSTTPFLYVRARICQQGMPDEQWTVYGPSDNRLLSYTIHDAQGNCLAATAQDGDVAEWSKPDVLVTKVVVARCDGSSRQKWNAPPNATDALPLKDISER